MLACAAAAIACPAKARTAAAPPRRIMSMMLCNDLLLLALAPRDRIASITHLAHGAVSVTMPGADRGVAINHGTAEEILQQRPDLILAGTYATPTARRLARQVGARLIEIAPVQSFADVRRVTRQVGALVGAPARAEAMIRAMDGTLRDLAATPVRRPVRVAAWSGSGGATMEGLFGAVLQAAGATNVAARADGRPGSFGTEQLLAARPAAILFGVDAWEAPSLNASLAHQPLVQKLYRGRSIAYPVPPIACGLPQAAGVARDLRRALAALPPGEPGW